jgi:flagellar hook-associated protein 2
MPVTFGGINTGLPPNLVEQLIEAERIPIKNVETRKSKTKSRLDLVNELDTKLRDISGSLKELAGTGGFTDIKLTSGDPNVIAGTVDPDASVNGSWNVEVLEMAQKAAAVTNGFPDKDRTEMGVGYFSFQTAEGTKEVYINGENSTLEKAAKALNSAGIGVQASVITDKRDPDNPFRLMIAGAGVGGDNQISYPRLYFLDGDQDLYFDEEREAKNGRVKIDGIEFEIPDNQIKDLIPGVTLDIRQASPGKSINVGVKEDREVVSGKIKSFVDASNAVLGFIQKQNQLNESSDTSSTLGGDNLLRTVESNLRRLFQDSQVGIGGNIRSLSQIGIAFNRNGLLEYSQDKFNSILAKQTEDVRNFFAGDGFATGFIPSVKRVIGNMTDGAFGSIGQRKQALQGRIKDADQRIENMEKNLQRKEQSLRRQFSNLEQTMSRIKAQGNYIQQRLGGANGSDGLNLGGGKLG